MYMSAVRRSLSIDHRQSSRLREEKKTIFGYRVPSQRRSKKKKKKAPNVGTRVDLVCSNTTMHSYARVALESTRLQAPRRRPSLVPLFLLLVMSTEFGVVAVEPGAYYDEIIANPVPVGGSDTLFFVINEPKSINYVYRAVYSQDFGGIFNKRYRSVHLVPSQPVDGCSEFQNSEEMMGSIAFITRGVCSFAEKGYYAELAGAIGVIIYDNDESNDHHWVDMVRDGDHYPVTIPALYMLGHDGWMIVKTIKKNGLRGAMISIPINETEVEAHQFSPGSLW
eukprot:m.267658 g.267658  ORF g.267658 m.267658 type:complete len:280 (+) comp74238_c0_seq1:102-941(+)